MKRDLLERREISSVAHAYSRARSPIAVGPVIAVERMRDAQTVYIYIYLKKGNKNRERMGSRSPNEERKEERRHKGTITSLYTLNIYATRKQLQHYSLKERPPCGRFVYERRLVQKPMPILTTRSERPTRRICSAYRPNSRD